MHKIRRGPRPAGTGYVNECFQQRSDYDDPKKIHMDPSGLFCITCSGCKRIHMGVNFERNHGVRLLWAEYFCGCDICFGNRFYWAESKKINAYDAERVKSKLKDVDFSIIEASVNENEIGEKLKDCGYTQNAEGLFHKKVEENVGDGAINVHYYAAIFQANADIDISKYVETYSKRAMSYNIGYVFVNENEERNLETLKNYIKETVVDVEMHRYRYKQFFAPIIITKDKIYYLKAGSIFSEYKDGVIEGLRILGYSK